MLLLAGSVLAAGVSGRWSGTATHSVDGNEMELPQELLLNQEGEVVSGTAGPGPEQQSPVSKSRLQGNVLTFEVRTADGAVFEYRLNIVGDEMTGEYKMTVDGQASTAKVALKKK